MKTITKQYKVYTFEELSQEAKDKAREKYNESGDYPFLQADIREFIHEKLTEAGYTHGDITPLYSLSYSQGDGLMFEGTLTDKDGNEYTIRHSGHYYHEKSTTIEARDKDGEEIDTDAWEETFYIPLCIEARDYGYEHIKWLESEELFRETCDANEYTFLEDGTMFNY